MKKNPIPIMTSNTQPSGEAFGSSTWTSTSEYFYAFNDSLNQNFTSNSSLPQYIGYKFTKSYKVVGYSVTSRNLNNDDLAIAPTEWELQGSNDNSVWETIDKRIGVVWTSKLEEKYYGLKNQQFFTYYRLLVTKNNGFATSIFGINQLKLFREREKLIINNPNSTNTKHYSLSDNTLIHLPDNTTESIIEHGIEQGRYIQLDVPFTKHKYFNENPVANASGKVFTQDIGVINTLSIKELVENKDFEPLYTWYDTRMTSNTAPSPLVASASSEYNANYAPFKAFNAILSGETNSWVTSSGVNNGWIQINFNKQIKVNMFSITSGDYSSSVGSEPKDFILYGSNNGTDFDEIISINNQTNWKLGEVRTYLLNQSANYSIFKLQVGSNNGFTYLRIAELKLGYKREVN